MFELLAIGLVLGVVFLAIGMVGAMLHLVFWLFLLPLRIAAVFVKVVLGVLLLPVLAVAAVVALLGVGVALLAPLLPLLVIGVLIWGVVKLASRPAVLPKA